MRLDVVDPAAYTPPYDAALCAALSRAGVSVTLRTSRFEYGEVPPPDGYERDECFYRWSPGRRAGSARTGVRALQHPVDMLRYRRTARHADVVHMQWFALQQVDRYLLPRRPLVLTAHDVLPREPRGGRSQWRAQRALYDAVDAVIVHSQHGRRRLVDELGVDGARVHTIPHGVLDGWVGREGALPPELHDTPSDVPVVLCFGLMRPYKGIDVLLDAWRGVSGAELWIVGMPRMDIAALQAGSSSSVRWVPRFVSDAEAAACFARADLAVLPYREIDQSGVLYTALGFGLPAVVSDVGGFSEVAADGVAALVPAGDARALGAALIRLIDDDQTREAMAAAARRAAAGPYAWDAIAQQTLDVYRTATTCRAAR